ncbi:MAG: hypothetical protein OES24_16805 [Acidimicrobiia bacterium]|nr:hypothetical protein [Acidimicrobiia bacterium]
MASPDDFRNLEQQLTRALRAHGDSVEPSPDAYSRLARMVDETPARSRWIGGLLAPRATALSGDSLRPLVFVTAMLAVSGLGGYSLLSLASSPAETATAAPATADVSDLVGRDEPSTEAEAAAIEADRVEDAESTSSDARMADSTEGSPRSSVPSVSARAGTASAAAISPVEQYAGLTYSPVRVTGLEAARAFLDLLAVDAIDGTEDVELEERNDRVIVRSTDASSDTDASILTTLTIEAKGDGFMVVDARSDRLELSIDSTTTIDPTADDIVDGAVVAGPVEVSGTTEYPTADVTVALRSVIDGSLLGASSASPEPGGDDRADYRLTIPVTGAERVWVVATTTSPDDGARSLAARSVLYSARRDPASYTVVGLPPDDPDGGLVVRSAPNGQAVGIIELGSTGVRRRPVPPRTVDGLTWWAVGDSTGLEGWAAARYLAVDESPAETTMVELARAVIAAVTEGDLTAAEGIGLSRPVFVGSIVDPRPISGPADVQALLATRRRVVNGGGDRSTLADFYGFDRWSDAEVFVPKGYREDGAAERAHAFFGDLPSVVIRSLNPATGGWERVHLFVSRNGDRPTLVGMVVEAEPLRDSAEASAEPATASRAGTDE